MRGTQSRQTPLPCDVDRQIVRSSSRLQIADLSPAPAHWVTQEKRKATKVAFRLTCTVSAGIEAVFNP